MFTREFIKQEYVQKRKSPNQIAEENNTYPNKVRRAIVKFGFKLRDKSEAQKNAIQKGRHPHPTKGKPRPADVKERISEAVSFKWKAMDPERHEQIIQKSKERWAAIPEEKRKLMQTKAAQAIRKAADEGSALEKHLVAALQAKGFNASAHVTGIVPNEDLEVDIYVVDYDAVIEIDGPAHFFPIWGEEALQKTIERDTEKNGLLLNKGYYVIRLKCVTKTLSEKKKRLALNAVLDVFDQISTGQLDKRYVEVLID